MGRQREGWSARRASGASAPGSCQGSNPAKREVQAAALPSCRTWTGRQPSSRTPQAQGEARASQAVGSGRRVRSNAVPAAQGLVTAAAGQQRATWHGACAVGCQPRGAAPGWRHLTSRRRGREDQAQKEEGSTHGPVARPGATGAHPCGSPNARVCRHRLPGQEQCWRRQQNRSSVPNTPQTQLRARSYHPVAQPCGDLQHKVAITATTADVSTTRGELPSIVRTTPASVALPPLASAAPR